MISHINKHWYYLCAWQFWWMGFFEYYAKNKEDKYISLVFFLAGIFIMCVAIYKKLDKEENGKD